MKTKNKIISKKDWYLKKIKEILENYIRYQDEDKYEDFEDEELLENFLDYETSEEKLINFIKDEIYDDLLDILSYVDNIKGQRDEQLGMIEFINLFSNLNLKIDDFRIETKNSIEKEYIWKIMFVHKKEKYEYLSDFFEVFIDENAEKILNEVIEKFIN